MLICFIENKIVCVLFVYATATTSIYKNYTHWFFCLMNIFKYRFYVFMMCEVAINKLWAASVIIASAVSWLYFWIDIRMWFSCFALTNSLFRKPNSPSYKPYLPFCNPNSPFSKPISPIYTPNSPIFAIQMHIFQIQFFANQIKPNGVLLITKNRI